MQNRNYLLTYDIDGKSTYAWLETEEELKELIGELYAGNHQVVINDKLEICQAREID